MTCEQCDRKLPEPVGRRRFCADCSRERKKAGERRGATTRTPSTASNSLPVAVKRYRERVDHERQRSLTYFYENREKVLARMREAQRRARRK